MSKHKNHLSLNSIRGFIKTKRSNSVLIYTLDHTFKERRKLDRNKASQMNDIPIKIMKENEDIVAFFIHQ